VIDLEPATRTQLEKMAGNGGLDMLMFDIVYR
jgi:hypothetical protein